MGTVLKVGVIVLPIIAFLAIFGQNIIEYFQDTAGTATNEGQTLVDTAGSSGFGN
jgi:hypothetical protein